jgi:hypothetical protein
MFFMNELSRYLNFAIAKFTGDERQRTRRRTCVPQVAVNEATSVKLAIPEGGKDKKNTLFLVH